MKTPNPTIPTPVLIRRPRRAKDDLSRPLIMNLTMTQLCGMRSNGEPFFSRDVAEVFLAIDSAIAKAGRRNPSVTTDEVILAALGIVQKMWDRRMSEWISGASHSKIHQPKANRLTGLLE